jgi:hypothetical protein
LIDGKPLATRGFFIERRFGRVAGLFLFRRRSGGPAGELSYVSESESDL